MVLFVVGARDSIIYAVLILFPDEYKRKYLSFGREMTQRHLLWFRPSLAAIQSRPGNSATGEEAPVVIDDAAVPDVPANFNYYHAVDKDTLTFWKKMAVSIKHEMRRRDMDPTLVGLKPAHDLVPFVVSLWNHVKGGEDVFGRILKNCKINFRSLSPFEY